MADRNRDLKLKPGIIDLQKMALRACHFRNQKDTDVVPVWNTNQFQNLKSS